MNIRYINVNINLLAGDVQKNNIMNAQKVCHEVKKISFVNGTNDREAYPKRWIAVLVQMNCEKKASTLLKKSGYETYIPIQQEIHQWSDRKKKINRLIIPMVVFVRATVSEEEWLRNQSYIYKLIALPGSNEDKRNFATPIPDYQIEQLKFMTENADKTITIEKPLHFGDKVRIIRGPLQGFEGKLCTLKNKKQVIAIMLDSLGYACVEVSINDIQIKN